MSPPAPPREQSAEVAALPAEAAHTERLIDNSTSSATCNGKSNGYANGSANGSPALNGSANGHPALNGSAVSVTPQYKSKEEEELLKPYTSPLVWKNVTTFVILHVMGLISLPLCLTFHTSIFTMLWSIFIGFWSAEGVLIGAHRLYSHKSFKATWQLRALVLALHTVAGQNCMYIWVRDHRLHHKFSDTNADPHNARRGFWYSHVGWLNMKKHPLVIEKGRQIDLSDLEKDSLLMFQKRWYKPLYVLLALVMPVYVPMWLWNEHFWDAFLCAYFLRYVTVLNLTWTVNSAAHLWGVKPYDANIMPAENPYVGFWGMGEGWHNYHHAFPWDYRAAEWGVHYSPTTRIIDWFVRRGWAYDLKFASEEMVRRRIQRTGEQPASEDHHHHHHIEEPEPDPEDMAREQQQQQQQEPQAVPVPPASTPALTTRYRANLPPH